MNTLNVVVSLLFLATHVSAFTNSFKPRRAHQFTWGGGSLLKAVPGADIEQEADETRSQTTDSRTFYRGKVNEVDYCIAPADVSLSRAYEQSSADASKPPKSSYSLTQVLNNAANRAVRRILLARCWPSEEALNLSLRLAASAEKQAQKEREASGSTAKCPVPRPILNLLMRKEAGSAGASQKARTSEQYVADQISAIRERYSNLTGYEVAEAYLESVLSLATSGDESPRINEVMESEIYKESYKKVLTVLKSVGVVLEEIPGENRRRISKKLKDQDFCLSVLDKITIQAASATGNVTSKLAPTDSVEHEPLEVGENGGKSRRKKFWSKEQDGISAESADASSNNGEPKKAKDEVGIVILSADEPTMTRQLNSLSNIVHRALLFGGDQELLVLSETLANNVPAFVDLWYPKNDDDRPRPGLDYLNALVMLLRQAYDEGSVTNLEPPVPLIQSYGNAYERLVASCVELGSGYVRPMPTSAMTMPIPRTAQEELGRFAVWEANARSGETTSYPEDLEGSWEVKDEVGGETIGISTVVLEPQGQVAVAPPLQGLRWRLDPGPTHLDTCTFQVLGEDGTVLQYRGFIDRGARLEARFSGRSTRIRGSVMFQMRDGDFATMADDFRKDMLPINYRTGTTKFVMTKQTASSEKLNP